jgi:hypothetical protein
MIVVITAHFNHKNLIPTKLPKKFIIAAIHKIFTLSLIFPSQAKTLKLIVIKIFKNINHQANFKSSQEGINFSPKST